MNVIVSNRQKEIIDNANIDAIKDLNGLFNVDDLVNKFKNYFFSKMVLDATSVVDFATRDVLQKLAAEIGPDRLIILLPSTPEPPEEFKKLLIELKIYNFSNNINDVVGFIDMPNTYENAMNSIMNSNNSNNEYYVDNSIKDTSNDNNEIINNNTEIINDSNNNSVMNNVSHSSLGDIMSNFNVAVDNNMPNTSENEVNDMPINQGDVNSNDVSNIYQVDSSDTKQENSPVEEITTVNRDSNTNSTRNVFLNMDDYGSEEDNEVKEKKIVGFKNITLHAGSTTLIYMLHKVAKKKNKDVLSIEINKDDFKLFRNNEMISIKEEDVPNTLNSSKKDIIFVDLNDYTDESVCNEVIYLVEPSTIKLNKLMVTDKTIFNSLRDKKVVLNKCMLLPEDIPVLEKEAGMSFYSSISALNERIDNSIIEKLFDQIMVE